MEEWKDYKKTAEETLYVVSKRGDSITAESLMIGVSEDVARALATALASTILDVSEILSGGDTDQESLINAFFDAARENRQFNKPLIGNA